MYHHPKSLHAIVKDLRQRGELDEIKWHNYQCSIRYVIVIYTLFNIIFIYLLFNEFTLLISIQALFLITLYFKFEAISAPISQFIFCTDRCKGKLCKEEGDDNTGIFSSGSEDAGLILIFLLAIIYILRPKYSKIYYTYNNPQDNFQLTQSVRIQKKYMKNYTAQKGEEISIAYLKEKPQQSIPLIKPITDIYQLKKTNTPHYFLAASFLFRASRNSTKSSPAR